MLFGIVHLLFYSLLFPFIPLLSKCSSSCCQCACFSRCALLLAQAGTSMKAGATAVFITSIHALNPVSQDGLNGSFVFVVLNLIGLAQHEKWDYCHRVQNNCKYFFGEGPADHNRKHEEALVSKFNKPNFFFIKDHLCYSTVLCFLN